MEKIPLGAVVQLKSGGPTMTVELRKSPTGLVCENHEYIFECVWFEGTDLRRGKFLGGALVWTDKPKKTAAEKAAERHRAEAVKRANESPQRLS